MSTSTLFFGVNAPAAPAYARPNAVCKSLFASPTRRAACALSACRTTTRLGARSSFHGTSLCPTIASRATVLHPFGNDLWKTTPVRPSSVRMMSSWRDDGEKSWGELAQDAANVGKSVFNKVKNSAGKLVTALVDTAKGALPSASSSPRTSSRPHESKPKDEDVSEPFPLYRERSFTDSFLSSPLTSVFQVLASPLKSAMETVRTGTSKTYERASSLVERDRRVVQAMGGLARTEAPYSTSSSSSVVSINGRSEKRTRTVLRFRVNGIHGAVADAEAVGDNGKITVDVELPSGEVVRIRDEGGDDDASGQVIDVEAK